MQAFECTGQWWLPDDETHRAAGTLKVSQSGAMRLWLVGALGDVSEFDSTGHLVVFGWVDKSPAGDLVTLRDCALGGSTVGSSGRTRENYHVARAFFGSHLRDPHDSAFDRMTLRLSGLSEWAHGYTGFKRRPGAAHAGNRTEAAAYEQKTPLEAEVPSGRLSLGASIAVEQTERERHFRETVDLTVSCHSAKSADDLNGDFVYPLQNLMTFVCDRPQEVEQFTVRAGKFPPYTGPEIRVIGPRVQPEDEEGPPEPVHHFQMLFTLKDVDFPSFVGTWLKVSDRYADACNVFFGLQYGPPAFIDLAFPSVVQALHLYYARRDDATAARAEEENRLRSFLSSLPAADADWIVDRLEEGQSPPLKVVLSKLIEEHAHIMNRLISNRQDRFVGSVINTLKYILTSDREMYGAASHSADLYWMMQKLRFLFKACLLRELGFSNDNVVALFLRNGLYHHVCELEVAEEARRQEA